MALLSFFLGIVIVVAYVLLRQINAASPPLARKVALGLAIWFLFTGLLAASGVLLRFDRIPPPVAILLVLSFVASTRLALSPAADALIDSAPVSWLIGWQAFRLPLEIFLHLGHRAGFVPIQLTWSQCNLDIITGVSAALLGWIASRRPLPRAVILAWNLVGFALLLNIVGIALLSMPTPLQRFPQSNIFAVQGVYVWLPTFLVQCAWFGHIIVFRRLRKRPESL